MRVFATLALVSVAACSSAFAVDQGVELQLSFGDSTAADFKVPESLRELGPFTQCWTIQGVEQSIEIFNYCTGRPHRQKSAVPEIERQEMFAGMWTPVRWMEASDGRTFRRSRAPSSLPPFNPHWLKDDLWPLTQSFFGDDSGPLKRSFLAKPITLPRPASLLLASKK
jgi:hypothetical protein